MQLTLKSFYDSDFAVWLRFRSFSDIACYEMRKLTIVPRFVFKVT